ncbi:MAG: DUF2513 domain-containing protein [Oceanibaculum nanhaiense]|uniref:DUF2513 domain-containing protein n=1 Tax=Oceanibaculum nanhaiense TaxID=1909734 RepID=UPI0032ED6330
MQRDMELVREILLEIHNRKGLKQKLVQLDGYEQEIIDRHVEMLFRAGLIDGVPIKTLDRPVAQVLVSDLSWDGHDFLAALRDKGVWAKIKSTLTAADLAMMPLQVLKDVGIALLKKSLMEKLDSL